MPRADSIAGPSKRSVWHAVPQRKRGSAANWGLGTILIALLAWPVPARTQDAVEWLTGPALARRLAEPSDVEWRDNATLRDSLTRLSRAVRVAIVLDRRIDPSREMKISAKNKPLLDARSTEGIFSAVAQYFNDTHTRENSLLRPAPAIEPKQFGNVVYLGPRETARNLRTLAEMRRDEVRKLPAPQAERLSSRITLRWEDLTTPRQVLADLAKRSGVEITGLDEQVPHDLWPAGDLPAMSFVEHLTLLAAEFDLSFHVEASGKQVRLAKITAEDVRLERTHDVPRNAAEVAEAWRRACPDAEIRQAGNKVTVRGRVEDHEWFTNPSKNKVVGKTGGTTITGTTKSRTVYTLTVKNKELREVIRSLAEQLKLTLKMDEEAIRAAGIDLRQLVSLSVKEAPLEKVFEAALPAGLKWKTQGNTLEISPAK